MSAPRLRVEKSRTVVPGGKAWRVYRIREEACSLGSGVTRQRSVLSAFYDWPAAMRYAAKVVGHEHAGRFVMPWNKPAC